jgi:hypothetical protein
MELLTKNSIKLIKEMNLIKNKYEKTDYKISKNNYFNQIKQKVIHIYKYFDDYFENKINELNIEKSNNHLNDNSYFIGTSIRNKIKNLQNNYKVNINNIELHFITNKNLTKKIKKKIKTIIKVISTIKKLFNNEKNYQSIIIYDINENKQLPKKKNSIIGPGNCNSGYCNVIKELNKNGSIVLYRNEELLKVLIHESIHANFIDFEIIVNQEHQNMDKKICTDYNILLNETFTETFACLLNCIFIHYYTNLNIDKIYNNEVKYMKYIFNHLMNFYNIEKIDNILVIDGCKRYFKQSTNVFSYYVLKTLNYLYMNDFLKIMKKCSNNYYKMNHNFNKIYIDFVFKNIHGLDKYIKKEVFKNRKFKLSLYELKLD